MGVAEGEGLTTVSSVFLEDVVFSVASAGEAEGSSFSSELSEGLGEADGSSEGEVEGVSDEEVVSSFDEEGEAEGVTPHADKEVEEKSKASRRQIAQICFFICFITHHLYVIIYN